jgi:hypothetical protein
MSSAGNDDPCTFVVVHKVHDGNMDRFEGTLGINMDDGHEGVATAAFRELDEQLSAPTGP